MDDNWIKILVYIDTPFDICLARRLLRTIYTSLDESIENFFAQIGSQHRFSHKEEPTKLMHILIWLLENYLSRHRKQYSDDRHKQIGIADLVLDGMKSTEEIPEIVITKLIALDRML